MNVIPPLTITDAILTSSTAAEPGTGETAWNAATSYAVGAQVIRSTTHRKYEALIAGVDATLPENALTGTTPRWLDVGPTNKWAMFDLLRNSATSQASPLTTVLTPGVRCDSLAILDTNADSITVTVTSGGATVFSRTTAMLDRTTLGWYDYFFRPLTSRPSLVMFDLPPYTNAVISITQTKTTGAVECGACVIGSYTYIGGAQYTASSDVLNFSSVTRDAFGNAKLVQRRNVPKTNQTLFLDKTVVDKARAARTALNATPAVWSGLDDAQTHEYFEALLILGFYRTFSINLAHPTAALITLELEEI